MRVLTCWICSAGMDQVQAALAERATKQATVERAVARQRRGKRKVGEHGDLEAGAIASAASAGHQEIVLMVSGATTVAPIPPQVVKTFGSSGGPEPGTLSQPSTTSNRPRMVHGGPSSVRSGIR